LNRSKELYKWVDGTIDYYNKNAQEYFTNTVNVDMTPLYSKFIKLLNPGDTICDLGCGSGRDSKFFTSKGYTVVSIDGSLEMTSLASIYLGEPVLCMKFDELEFHDKFDAMWACSSLLHVPKNGLPDIIDKIILSVKNNAVIYICFKEGLSEREENGRIFSDFTQDEFLHFLSGFNSLIPIELWPSQDVRNSRKSTTWLNVLLRVTKKKQSGEN